jgi:Anhydro-N-acetylmuramic acid kinase
VFIATLFAHDLIRKPVPTFRDHAPCYAGGGAGCVTGPALYAKALDAKVLGLAEALVDRIPGSVMPEQIASELPAGASILAIGLMSGTSQDGVDVALIDTDGEHIAQLGATASHFPARPARRIR